MRIIGIVVITFLITVHCLAQPSLLTEIDSIVEKAMKRFDVPGIGLAIVRDGKVLTAKGYGVRELGKPAKVDEHTLFGIASNTKAFTATALGMLVEDGKVSWDARVIDYLPGFQLSDPYVSREMRVRDLLVHRSGLGLGAGDLLWWPSGTYDRKEIVRRLRYIPLATSFRSAYAYDNVLYLAAGEVIEAVSGRPWEEFVHTRILKRIGMFESTVTCSFPRTGNVAITHAKVDGILRTVEPDTSSTTNPAGGIHASAHDMALWMITQLDSGKLSDGSRLFSARTTRQLWSLVTPINPGNPPASLAPSRPDFSGYGLGFFVRDYRGMKVVTHDGGLPGYVSRVFLLPGEKVGIALLTNQESTPALGAIVYALADLFLDVPPFDWLGGYSRLSEQRDSVVQASEQSMMSLRDSLSHPSLPLAKYAGTYRDPWYGDVSVTANEGRLSLRFSHTPTLSGPLVHYQYDTFIARWTDRELRADAFVTFDLNPDGSINQVRMKAVSRATDFSFDFQDLELKPAASRSDR
jgi:CubicO group peptidase (beta-lactamase class C family)